MYQMRKFLLPLVILCAFAEHSSAQISGGLLARYQFVLDSVCTASNIKGASAAVLMPGQGIWKGAYGESHSGQPITTDMLFGIGSNTKTYVSTLLLKLQEDGLLSLDDTIGTWIQAVPNVNGQVTVRQLLNHSSGIYNFTNHPGFNTALNNDFTAVWQPEQVLQFIDVPSFAPGAGWEYSNSNYLVAGLIVKDIMGTSFEVALRDSILAPLGLNNTVFFPFETPTGTVPHSWSIYFGQPYLQDIFTGFGYDHTAMFSMASAAGAIMATAEDNVVFWDKLHSGNIINNNSLQEMRTFIPISGSKKYGLGIFRINSFNSRVVFSHGGTNIGFINENIVDSISGVCISVLTNQDSVSNAILLQRLITVLHRESFGPLAVQAVTSRPVNAVLYPNPARDYININTGTQEELAVSITDISGREISRQSITTIGTVSLQGLTSGVYYVAISRKNEVPVIYKISKL